ncbi:carbohydrate ABC transporter permease [[Mycoplasma] cavipharyngis]|uniref:carbohydrate ABC transporter permease n=1 Tax=[Mycoplasma] cavipharyngis TaxID=92757 RepID=UPI0037037CAD
MLKKSSNFNFWASDWQNQKRLKSKSQKWINQHLKINKNQIKILLSMLPLVLIVAIFLITPFITNIFESFKITTVNDRVNYTLGIKNFQDVINDPEFHAAFYYSNIILFVGLPIGFVLSFILSLLINTILNRIFNNLIVITLFSQFFISSFAIGIAFVYLFDAEKAAFNQIFKTNFNFTDGNNNLIVLILFHVWRILPFNTIILLFHFTSQKRKYHSLISIDKLTFTDKVINVFFQKIRPVLFLLIYINVLQALLLNPFAIYDQNTLQNNNIFTFSYYIYYYLKLFQIPLFDRAGAASILVLSYLVLISLVIITFYLLISHHQKMINIWQWSINWLINLKKKYLKN